MRGIENLEGLDVARLGKVKAKTSEEAKSRLEIVEWIKERMRDQ